MLVVPLKSGRDEITARVEGARVYLPEHPYAEVYAHESVYCRGWRITERRTGLAVGASDYDEASDGISLDAAIAFANDKLSAAGMNAARWNELIAANPHHNPDPAYTT